MSADKEESYINQNQSISNREAFIYMRIPPDKGWAWVVLAFSFLAGAIIDGILLCIGHLLPEIAKELSLNTSSSSMISSIQYGLYFLVGPFVSAAMNKFGFRIIGCIGAIFCAGGLLAGSVSKDFVLLLIMYGVIVGIGFGMIFASSQVVVGYYFEKYRAIATGISCAGTGFGTLIFSRLNQYLVKEVGWRHTLQVQGGFCIIIAIICLAFRPVPLKKIGSLDPTHVNDSELSFELAFARYSNIFSADILQQTEEESLEYNVPAKDRKEPSFWRKICPCCYEKTNPIAEENPDTNIRIVEAGPIYRDDIFYGGNVMDLPEYQRHDSKDPVSLEQKRNSISYNLSVTRVPRETGVKKKRCQIPTSIKDAFNLLLDMSIVKLFKFQVILFSAFLVVLGNNIPYLFITCIDSFYMIYGRSYTAWQVRAEIPEEYANWLLPSVGILSIGFRIGSGFLSFKLKKVDPAYLVGGGLIISGLVGVLSSGYGQNLIWFQFLHVFVFGLGTSLLSTLRSIIFVHVLGLSKLTNAFGISSLVMGIAIFTGTALGGVLVDATGNYDAAFQFSGWTHLLSGMFHCYIPYIASK